MTKKTLTLDETEKKQGAELFTKKNVDNTPFQIVHKDNKYFVVLGQYKLTEDMESEIEAKTWTEVITWNKILQIISLAHEILTNKN